MCVSVCVCLCVSYRTCILVGEVQHDREGVLDVAGTAKHTADTHTHTHTYTDVHAQARISRASQRLDGHTNVCVCVCVLHSPVHNPDIIIARSCNLIQIQIHSLCHH